MSTTARVQVTVEFSMNSYGADWTLGAVVEHVKKEAPQLLANRMKGTGVRIVGDLKVAVVTCTED